MPQRGQYKVIRADGAESLHRGKLTTRAIQMLIGCGMLDTVRIGPRGELTMFVHDSGMIDGKPVSPKATSLYHAVCKTGTVWAIHGDVVIVRAAGWA